MVNNCANKAIRTSSSSFDLLNLENRTWEAMALELEDMYQHEVQMMITVEMDAEEIDGLIFGTETVMLAGCD